MTLNYGAGCPRVLEHACALSDIRTKQKQKEKKKEKIPPKIILPAVYTITSSLLPNSLKIFQEPPSSCLPRGKKKFGKKERRQ